MPAITATREKPAVTAMSSARRIKRLPNPACWLLVLRVAVSPTGRICGADHKQKRTVALDDKKNNRNKGNVRSHAGQALLGVEVNR